MTDQAHATAVRRLSGAPTGPGDFAVRSETTDPTQEWAVTWVNSRNVYCGCPAFAHAHEGRCKHVLAVFDAIAREWQERRTAGKPTREGVAP